MISGMKRNWNTFSTFWIINELLVFPYAAFMRQAKKINIPLHKLPFRFAEWNIIAVKYIKHLMKYVFFYDSYFDAREMNEEMKNIQHINKQVLCNCEMEIYKACFSCFTFFSAPEIIFLGNGSIMQFMALRAFWLTELYSISVYETRLQFYGFKFGVWMEGTALKIYLKLFSWIEEVNILGKEQILWEFWIDWC